VLKYACSIVYIPVSHINIHHYSVISVMVVNGVSCTSSVLCSVLTVDLASFTSCVPSHVLILGAFVFTPEQECVMKITEVLCFVTSLCEYQAPAVHLTLS